MIFFDRKKKNISANTVISFIWFLILNYESYNYEAYTPFKL